MVGSRSSADHRKVPREQNNCANRHERTLCRSVVSNGSNDSPPLAACPGIRSIHQKMPFASRSLDKAVVFGKVILSSGREADYYVDLRRVTLDAQAAPLVGAALLDATADLLTTKLSAA